MVRATRQFLNIIACVLLSGAPFQTDGAVLPAGFTETQITGLSAPTAMELAPDGRLFVCLQGGDLRVIKNGALLPTPFVSLNVDSTGERGLLGIAFDPNFTTNNFLYVYYTVPSSPRHNRVSRFTANGDVAAAGSEFILLELDNLSGATNHNGGAIHFGPDGKLYIGVGENAAPSNSQTLATVLGKVLRINSDGTIPTDNPFFNTAIGNNRAIWALGLRNPFTFAFQPGTGRLFINDVGQSAWEEINDGIAGSNYGWPTTEGPTSNPGFRSPLFSYGHGASSTTGCAIAGGTFYNPTVSQFPGTYISKYFFADLCSGWIRVFDPSTNTASGFATGISQPVDLKVGADGSLYYLSIGSSSLFRVTFNGTSPPQLITEDGTTDSAASLESVWLMRDPFALLNLRNFSSDQRTRITLFALNVDLSPNEDASAILAQIRDAQMNVYVPTVEFVGKPVGIAPFTQIALRLPDNLPQSQTLMVSITFRGQTSNVVRIRTN